MLTSLPWPLCGCCSSESYCGSVSGDAYSVSCRERKLRTTLVKRSIATIFVALLAFVAFPNAWGQSSSVVKMRTLQIDAEARPGFGQFAPADDDVQRLVYELFVTNWNEQDLRFAAIDVEDAATGQRLARFDSKALDDPLRLSTTMLKGTGRLLPAWRTAIITMEVKLPLGASVPAAVRHRIEFESDPNLQLIREDGSLSSELVSFSKQMSINRRPPLIIDAPLRGGPWRCGNGGGTFNSHDAIYASHNIARLHVPQRFGCDFRKVDANGDVLPSPFPDIISNSMFYGYLADVIAVADGLVVKTEDGIPENVPRADGKVITPALLTDKTNAGNMVALEIGKGQYAFYAHLQPGSLRVKVGDRVRKGQLLGKVGNSGNSVGPHLHFHVGIGPELNRYDFLPHVYRSYWLSGYARHGKPDPAKRRRIDFKVPTDGSFVTFPSK
jgi:murein DD-endopeptidase